MSVKAHTDNTKPIDAVITWVDGNDPRHKAKIEPFFKKTKRHKIPGAIPTRYNSVYEIKYCILSIFTFAPYIRNVYIITDEQDPGLYDVIKSYFPERAGSVKIIDHKDVFKGFENYLPAFNSRSIECMIWRIDGLSKNFIYFNDDTFLIRETKPEDWFINEKVVLRGKWLFIPWYRFFWNHIQNLINKGLLNNKNFQPRPSYHLGQWMSASILGFKKKYFFFSHTPFALNRNTAETFFNNNKEIIRKNLEYRFKKHDQFNFVALLYHLELQQGNAFVERPNLAYLQPYKRSKNYIDTKINYCKSNKNIKFLCVQSLDMCSQQTQEKVFLWLEEILNLKVNKK